MNENAISGLIIGAAIEVHRNLGPGLLESVYEEALAYELSERDLRVERQKQQPIVYKDITLGTPLRIDLLVGGLIIVECKAVEQHNPIYEA